MKLENIMSKNVIVADIDTELNEISKIMLENDIGFIPISENKKIIGVLTDRDIVTKIIANNDNKIRGYISRNIISINVNDTIEFASELMTSKKVKRLLVQDNNKLVGILSISDIIGKIDDSILLESIKKIWKINRNTDEYPVKINEFEL